jgi:hypothetical protein
MGAGGIIQQHAIVLLTAVSDPSIYDSLCSKDKDRVELIRAENPVMRTKGDVIFLFCKLIEACFN